MPAATQGHSEDLDRLLSTARVGRGGKHDGTRIGRRLGRIVTASSIGEGASSRRPQKCMWRGQIVQRQRKVLGGTRRGYTPVGRESWAVDARACRSRLGLDTAQVHSDDGQVVHRQGEAGEETTSGPRIGELAADRTATRIRCGGLIRAAPSVPVWWTDCSADKSSLGGQVEAARRRAGELGLGPRALLESRLASSARRTGRRQG